MKKILSILLVFVMALSWMPAAAFADEAKADCFIKADKDFVKGKMPINYVIDYYAGTQSLTWFRALIEVDCGAGNLMYHKIIGPKKPILPKSEEKGIDYAEMPCPASQVRAVTLKSFDFETGYAVPAVNTDYPAAKKEEPVDAGTIIILSILGLVVIGGTIALLSVAVPISN